MNCCSVWVVQYLQEDAYRRALMILDIPRSTISEQRLLCLVVRWPMQVWHQRWLEFHQTIT